METYKHFVTISSQLYFCSSPIRLDSYNRCQFGCVYCFARNRGNERIEHELKYANSKAFARRLERISKGEIQSALDEFLQARIPIQLGGLYEPFCSMEENYKVTYDLLSILQDHDYPTLISTKGNIITLDAYSKILHRMNVYVRISAAGVNERYREEVDVGCGPFNKVLERIKFISGMGIPVSLRIQPVIPGFEKYALEMTAQAAYAGASHISFEYLKLASEGLKRNIENISKAINFDIWDKMDNLGLKRVGRDYTLKANVKREFLSRAKKLCDDLGIKFGAGDTEFIHLSDGDGCCNGSSYFLKNTQQFRANLVGVLSNRSMGDLIYFNDVAKEWSPLSNVHRYLTTNSRSRDMSGTYSSWLSLLAYRWNGGKGPYSPIFFHGVDWTGRKDKEGFKIYEITDNV